MSAQGLVLFETPIGPCGISWGARGITALQFPGESEAETRAELSRRFPEARPIEPPAFVAEAIAAIIALLEGADDDLTSIPLDPDHIAPFNQRVYDVTRRIPPGQTLTYGEVAAAIGEPGAARAVGRALDQVDPHEREAEHQRKPSHDVGTPDHFAPGGRLQEARRDQHDRADEDA